MKNILILSLILGFSNLLTAQNVIDKHFNYMIEQEDATHISVTGKMFELINSIDIESDDAEFNEAKEMLANIKSFELVAGKNYTNAKNRYRQGVSKLGSAYEELVKVQDKETDFTLYIDESNGTVHEIVGIGAHDSDMFVFSLLGSMRLDQVGRVVSKIQASNLGGFDQLKEVSIDKVKVYPNPVRSSSQLNLELPDDLSDADISLYDLSGKRIKSYGANDGALNLSGVSAGTYFIHIEKSGVQLKKKILVVQ